MQQKTEPRLTKTGHYTLEVSNPVSVPAQTTLQSAPRLADLNGKTICEVWNGPGWRAPETFPYIEELLKARFPDINIIPYTEFPPYYVGPEGAYGVVIKEDPAKIAPVIKEKGCDAVILGNGG